MRESGVRAPEFWARPGVLPTLLSPFAAVWTSAARGRQSATKSARIDRPVICVGNLVAGGAGKHSVFVPTFGATRSVTRRIEA